MRARKIIASIALLIFLIYPVHSYLPTLRYEATGARIKRPASSPGFPPSSREDASGPWRFSTSLQCQLLGMNCATPTDFAFSLQGFCRRGGGTDIHADGWGLAFYDADYQDDSFIHQFHETKPAAESLIASMIAEDPIRTVNMMSHIRYATVGKVEVSNVHPFVRELWNIPWSFCHNGEVPMFRDSGVNRRLTSLGGNDDIPPQFTPLGTTDSEAAFCAILNALAAKFTDRMPTLPVLYDSIKLLCDELVGFDVDGTIFNFLLTCGPHVQWAYSWPGSRPGSKVWNGLHYTTREYPFRRARLSDVDYEVDFSLVTNPDDCVSVIATKPLAHDETWTELQRGELLLFDCGRPKWTPRDLFEVELSGHGLQSKTAKPPEVRQDMRAYRFSPDHFTGGAGI